MSNKEDMKKVEEYLESKEIERKSKYKLDLLEELEKKRQYQGSTKQKTFKSISKFVKIFFSLIAIFFAAIIIIFIGYKIYDLSYKHNINIEQQIEGDIYESVTCIYEDTDILGNGLYIFTPKSNSEIQIHATKRYGRYNEDSSARYLKYYFEKWEDEYKSNFITEESLKVSSSYPEKTADGWFLSYTAYTLVSNYDELVEATDAIIRFFKFMNGSDSEQISAVQSGMLIIINYNGHNIYPASRFPSEYEEVRKRVIQSYNEIVEN